MNRKSEYILCVAEYGSLLKASEKLYITPSALSKYISKVEEEVGVPLFDRIGKKFVLTYAGKRYLDWLKKMSQLQKEMDDELRDIVSSTRGLIRLGVQMSGVGYLVNDVLPRFYEQYPGIKIELYEDTSNGLKKLLDDNLLDFAIISENQKNENLSYNFLANNHRVLVVPADHFLFQYAVTKQGFFYPWVDFSLLKNERFIAPFKNQETYHFFEQIPREYGFSPNIILQTRDFGTMIQCVEKRIGITITMDQIIKANCRSMDVHLLSFGKSCEKETKLQIYYQKKHYISAAASTLIHLIQSAYHGNE